MNHQRLYNDKQQQHKHCVSHFWQSQKDPNHFLWSSCEVKKQHENKAPFDVGDKAVKNCRVSEMPTACNINTSSVTGPSCYNVFLILISLFTLHVLFGYLIPSTIKLESFSTFVARCIDSSPVYCIYCKRGYCRWSLTGLILVLLGLYVCVCLKSVKDSSRCKRRGEQECSRLANCRSCSLNVNCQWELQQQECQALPGEDKYCHTLTHIVNYHTPYQISNKHVFVLVR